jgi:hypothetical protein
MKLNVICLVLLLFLSLHLHAEEADENNILTGLSVVADSLSLQETSDVVVDTDIIIVGRWGDYIFNIKVKQEPKP